MICSNFFFSSERIETRTGFCDHSLVEMVNSIPILHSTIEALSRSGFTYSGDTRSASKANTDAYKKKIYIGRDKTVSEACLSLAYEMTNAKNALRFKEVHAKYLTDKTPSMEKGVMYAREILQIEAEAVFIRSVVAISVGLESQIKNKKYLDVVRSSSDQSACIAEIFAEMLKTGTVHNGKKKALDHYIAQYWVHCTIPRKEV